VNDNKIQIIKDDGIGLRGLFQLLWNDRKRIIQITTVVTFIGVIYALLLTPLAERNEPELSYVRSTLSTIQPYLSENKILILESTTYHGTTEEEVAPIVEDAGY